jgi:hypothetical protein
MSSNGMNIKSNGKLEKSAERVFDVQSGEYSSLSIRVRTRCGHFFLSQDEAEELASFIGLAIDESNKLKAA